MTLGEIIKEFRERNSMSQRKFAELSNLSNSYISMLERNANSKNGEPIKPSLETLKAVSDVMNIPLDDVLRRLDDGIEINISERNMTNINIRLGEQIKKYRILAEYTQPQLAAKLHITQGAVNQWETGKTAPDVEQIPLIAKALGVTTGELYGEAPTAELQRPHRDALPIAKRRIPLLGTIHCGEPTFSGEDFEAYVEVGTNVRADFALRAKGDSMIGARIQDGDLVFIRQQESVNSGEIAAIIIDDETALKRVRFLPGGMIMLQAENPNYEPIFIDQQETRQVRVLGKAVAFQGDVK